jgi:serine racemase
VVHDLVDHVVVVTDQGIVAAMRLVFERMKLVVEPSGAAGLAAVLSPGFAQVVQRVQQQQQQNQQQGCLGAAAAAGVPGSGGAGAALNIGIILCGGNLDFESKGFFNMDNWVAEG